MKLTLHQLRKKIDQLDKEIIQCLAKRKLLVSKIGKIKQQLGGNIQDKKRENELMSLYQKLCMRYGLNINYIKKIFKIIIANSKKLQK